MFESQCEFGRISRMTLDFKSNTHLTPASLLPYSSEREVQRSTCVGQTVLVCQRQASFIERDVRGRFSVFVNGDEPYVLKRLVTVLPVWDTYGVHIYRCHDIFVT